jgi:hypothetical protein
LSPVYRCEDLAFAIHPTPKRICVGKSGTESLWRASEGHYGLVRINTHKVVLLGLQNFMNFILIPSISKTAMYVTVRYEHVVQHDAKYYEHNGKHLSMKCQRDLC